MKIYRYPVAMLAVALTACVTINIYFPAEKVESVAEEIVDEIRGAQPLQTPDQAPTSSTLWHRFGWLADMSFLTTSTAWAADVTDISNPTIRSLKTRMKARFEQLKPFFLSKVISEGADGYIALTGAGSLDLKTRRQVASLVDAENKDRQQLYQAVAAAMGIDASQIDRVAAIFAKQWVQSVPR
jgi:uncharacterized protein YdbL (DUF1318 family)